MTQVDMFCPRHQFITAGCDACDYRRRLLERQVAAMNTFPRDDETVDAAVARICRINEQGARHGSRPEDDARR